MNAEISIAGSGGQGVLLIGRILAEAGFLEGREVCWLPSYGAEKRGGTVGCSVTISEEKIGSLVITRPDAAIAMNQTSAIKLESTMKADSLLVINQSLADLRSKREDIRVVYVPATQMAIELGNDSVANLITLGAMISGCPMVSQSSIETVMNNMFARNPKALEMNKKAFARGLDFRLLN
jgi:2-oxoglutarate ferredoxin oxidoreductase subunit gamma